MVYRFKPSERKYEIREKKPYRRAGADSPRRLYGYRRDEIDLSVLFELSKLEGDAYDKRIAEIKAEVLEYYSDDYFSENVYYNYGMDQIIEKLVILK